MRENARGCGWCGDMAMESPPSMLHRVVAKRDGFRGQWCFPIAGTSLLLCAVLWSTEGEFRAEVDPRTVGT